MASKQRKAEDKKKGKLRRGPCPCQSGQPYRSCCEPAHLGTPAEDAVALMRSRFCAFALGASDYLVETLHPDHEDLKLGRDAVRHGVQMTSATMRFTGLQIVDAREQGDHARVLFVAKVFEKGKDRSFAELSDFGRTPEGWRYRSGFSRTLAELGDPNTLSIDTFEANSS